MKQSITTEVISRLKGGDITAFDEMYVATIDQVYKTVYVLAPNKQEVDEIVNEIYFQIWKSIINYDESLPFLYWLNGLVFRQVKNWRLKAWRRIEIFQKLKISSIEQNLTNDDDFLKDHNQHLVLSMLDTMSYKLKEVMLLYYFYDYSLKEIANILSIPTGTVKSRHHSAIKYLRKEHGESIKSGKVGVHEW